MSILNKYKEWRTQIKILYDKYMDFVLSLDSTPTIPLNGKMTDKCLSAFIDFSNNKCYENNGIYSLSSYTYDEAINSGCTLYDIGFTGIDNGFIHYEKDKITNQEFFDIFTGSTYTINSGDTRLFLTKITGNTGAYSYEMNEENNETDGKFYALKGGFFQGFTKLFGFDYQVLPTVIDSEWNLEFVLRPTDYEINDNSLNKTHEGNEGIFFYMGTRAENKFAQLYNTDFSEYNDREIDDKYNNRCEEFMNGGGYFLYNEKDAKTEYNCLCNKKKEQCQKTSTNQNALFMWDYFFSNFGYSEYSDCGCKEKIIEENCVDTEEDEYFSDGYFNNDCEKCTQEPGYYNSDDYSVNDISLSGVTLETSEGRNINDSNYFEIETDNKFITFNRTKTGFTANNFDEDGKIILTGQTSTYTGNLFLDLNRTKTGHTAEDIEELYETSSSGTNKYDILKDIENNSFALKINDDGSIGYKYMVKDCDSESGYTILEEKSYPNIIKKDEWSVINVKMKPLTGTLNKCGTSDGKRGMVIYIYVNGYLKFVSKELPELTFKELNDTYDKQEGVPYSISLGGGTQGLCDSVWLDYYLPFSKILPIEENFAGTFIGDIKSFKFYTCSLQYNEIKNNYLSILG